MGLIVANCLDFADVQETKLLEVFQSLMFYPWGNPHYDLSFPPSVGSSGIIIVIWCSSKVKSLISFSGPGFL